MNKKRKKSPKLSVLIGLLVIFFGFTLPSFSNETKVTLGEILKVKGFNGLKNYCDKLLLLKSEKIHFSPEDFQNLGYQLIKGKKPVDAQKIFKLGTKIYPEAISLYYSLARAYRSNGNQQKELETFNIVSKIRNQMILKKYLKDNKNKILNNAQQVIDKYIEAIGGKRAVLKIKTLTLKLAPLDGINSTPFIKRSYKYPNLIRQEIIKPGIVRVTNGKKVWKKIDSGWEEQSNHPMRYMPNIYQDFINYQNRGISYKYTGLEAFDYEVFYHLVKLYPSGESRHFYFSAKTGLLMVARRVFGGSMDIKRICDYRQVGEILYPHLEVITAKVGMGEFHGSILTDIKINPPLDDSLFNKSYFEKEK